MLTIKILTVSFACMVQVVLGRPGYAGHAVDYYSPPSYAFKYGVTDLHTGDVKSQQETRVGGVVKGQYSLVEPDGSIRTVDYKADPVHGFNAVVSKSPPFSGHPPPPPPPPPINRVQIIPAVVKKLVPAPPPPPRPPVIFPRITKQHYPTPILGSYGNGYYDDYQETYGDGYGNIYFYDGAGYGHY
ncbi:cuticle protein 19-like [Photinus pyralis]|uniref:cuticle protein 19-like n=1 Tax=Photinus pyralis TaxID=7054 RepID=UPI00126735E8|nr:cuticle protein 19-like [Photinus pyralis]